jgi:hypothetical protein
LRRTTSTVLIDLQDQVGGAVDDGAQLLSLPLECLVQPGVQERDTEFVSGEQDDPDAILVELASRTWPDPDDGTGREVAQHHGATAR